LFRNHQLHQKAPDRILRKARIRDFNIRKRNIEGIAEVLKSLLLPLDKTAPIFLGKFLTPVSYYRYLLLPLFLPFSEIKHDLRLIAKLTAKPRENQRNRETSGDKTTRVTHHQTAPAALPGRLLASWEK
jgi:hypothetical protein